MAGTLYDNTATTYTIDKSDADLVTPAGGFTTITVANLNRITVLGDNGETLFSAFFGSVGATLAPLLLLN